MSARAALVAQAKALRAQADALEALAATLPTVEADDLIGVAECAAKYNVGRDALRRASERGELAVSRGPRQRLLVRRSAVVAWLESKPLRGPDREGWAA
ncbi:MAG: helix-turn-helix domain-containing protein [Myxococcales bacterium]